MEIFPYHVFVCEQRKPDGVPCCAARDSAAVLEVLRREVAQHGLSETVQVTACGSLGLCERGPNLVVYPEGVWYSGVTPADVPELVESHFVHGVPVRRLVNTDAAAVKQEIQTNRNRHLQSVRAREAAGAMPDDLQQSLRAFQDSRVLLTAIELDVFTAIGKSATAAEVAARVGANSRSTGMLLDAVVALGLLVKRDSVYSCTPAAERFFVAGAPFDSRAAMGHMIHLWTTWSSLTEAVRTGTTVCRGVNERRDDTWTEPFIAAMHRIASERAPHVTAAVGAAGLRRMLDVGGGSGAYSIAFAQAAPELEGDILDLGAVLSIAQRHIDAAGLTARIHTRAGDLRRDTLGQDYDLILVSAICHMLSEEENLDLLQRCFAATAAGGRVVISDFILEPDRTAPKFAALFALNMLVGTPAGNSYTEAEYTQWLNAAGYGDVRRVRLPGTAHLMIGTKA